MRVCSFKYCKNKSFYNNSTSFFTYPKCPEQFKIWQELSGNTRATKYSRVCEKHFNPEDVIRSGNSRPLLRQGAIPNWNSQNSGEWFKCK